MDFKTYSTVGKRIKDQGGEEMVESRSRRVGIWLRASAEDQARGESPEDQERRARLYAAAKGWQVEETYLLEAVGGQSVMDQQETQRMLDDIQKGRISALIFSKLAHLAGNRKELFAFADLFDQYEADLVSLQEAIDTSTPGWGLFYTILAAMAQWEQEDIAERVADSVRVRAQRGKPVGGQAPFGYQWKDEQLIPDPQEAPVRRLMYELFVEHRRKKTVARLLNDAGYRTRRGAKFSDTTVGRLLQDPTAKGLRRANYTKSLGDDKPWVEKPEEEWIYTEVEPIVAEELWERCNDILEQQRPARKTVHLFAGIVTCHCGNKMYVPSNSPKYTCAKCRNKIGSDDLEAIFQEQLKAFVFSPTDIAEHLAQVDRQIKDKNELLEALIAEEGKTKQEMEKVYALYIRDEISGEGFAERYKPLEERLEQIGDEIVALQGEIDFRRIQYLASDEILNEAQELYPRWPQLTAREKRSIVENVLKSIVIGDGSVAMQLRHIPTLPK
jgi:site-specific DNA recombinase